MPKRQVIHAPDGAKLKAPLSHAVRVGDLVFVSGTPGYFGDRQLARGDFAAQFHQAMRNVGAVLEAAGTTLSSICKVNIILARRDDFWPMNELYRQYFAEGDFPARTTIIAGLPIDDMLIEIECVAEVVS
jgi:2-iminobutanoate/2-iminopropanoate deaminase